jgi:hypothetical protein
LVGLLKGGTKTLFGELLGPLYMAARVTDRNLTYGADGSIQRGAGPRDCRARVDSATQRMREAAGYTQTDRAIYILASTLAGELTTDAELEIFEGDYAGATFGIASIDRPPGASYFLCRGTKRG